MQHEHISKRFDAELENVRSRVLQMGGFVEQQIERALEALTSGNAALMDQVIADDHRVNGMEVSIDEECSMIIARRQPTAVDLRMMMTVIKIITDLERVGDEAEKIARMAKLMYQGDRLTSPRLTEIRHAADLALAMLRESLDAFARLDVAAAARVVRQDQRVDEEFRSILRQLITFMMEDPRTITMALEIVFIAKAIERIGDHAKNMAEYVVYMVQGRNVRHVKFEEWERDTDTHSATISHSDSAL
ncbi:MAG TPA: phosphate signaling complex protein PhoU [Burkholderiales bacterium]|nr:phosphate signaling complex protein PhoU [Burkholderiales bacterium]